MDPKLMKEIAEFLAASGPFGLVAVLGWAYWKSNVRKDAELKSIYERIVGLTEAQTVALAKIEAALLSLKEAIERMGK